MNLRIHDNGKSIMLQRYDKRYYRWKNVAGPYKHMNNAKVGLRHYQKYRGENFAVRVGKQVMALKNWGDVVL